MKQNCCPVVSVEMSGFQPLKIRDESDSNKKNNLILYARLFHFILLCTALSVVSRRLFLLVGRLSRNDDGERQRQRQKRPESHIKKCK